MILMMIDLSMVLRVFIEHQMLWASLCYRVAGALALVREVIDLHNTLQLYIFIE